MKLSTTIVALSTFTAVRALHFYFESNEVRCFLEELPSETIVEGHYNTYLWNENGKIWETDEAIGIHVSVEELASSHVVVNTRGPPEGRFTFTSHEAGDHNICLHTNISGGWLTNEHIKMYLDLNVGSARLDNSVDKTHVTTLSTKIRELNHKIGDIQREQRYMREVEASFRDASELTNARAFWWSLLQIAVLIGTAIWQMRHLKVYFEDKKRS